ncbi:hypothetical protein [Endozoicomonas sp. OPT23]|uniref:hypothetical protein n=1 Tax=Endozoicomonas sp. OPT23 TaxID=2072845 RepID=UPI00129ACE3D|nr:hypothetical protein [Endozoicomonas sp. OPT23]
MVSFYHEKELKALLEARIYDAFLNKDHAEDQQRLREQIASIVSNDQLSHRAGLLRLLHWYFKKMNHSGSLTGKDSNELLLMLRDQWLTHLHNDFDLEIKQLISDFIAAGYEYDEANLPNMLENKNIQAFIDQKVASRSEQETLINGLLTHIYKGQQSAFTHIFQTDSGLIEELDIQSWIDQVVPEYRQKIRQQVSLYWQEVNTQELPPPFSQHVRTRALFREVQQNLWQAIAEYSKWKQIKDLLSWYVSTAFILPEEVASTEISASLLKLKTTPWLDIAQSRFSTRMRELSLKLASFNPEIKNEQTHTLRLNRAREFLDNIEDTAFKEELEILITDILKDEMVQEECASSSADRVDSTFVSTVPNHALAARPPQKDKVMILPAHDSKIQLTSPTSESELLSITDVRYRPHKDSINEALEFFGIPFLKAQNNEPVSFTDAYAKLKACNWSDIQNKVSNEYPQKHLPLGSVPLHLQERAYSAKELSQILVLINPNAKTDFPSYVGRDTVIQAIKAAFPNSRGLVTSNEKPLIIIDLTQSLALQLANNPRITLLTTKKINEHIVVNQEVISLDRLNRIIQDKQAVDFVARVFATPCSPSLTGTGKPQNQDYWFWLKPPKPPTNKRVSSASLADGKHSLSSATDQDELPIRKKNRITLSFPSPIEFDTPDSTTQQQLVESNEPIKPSLAKRIKLDPEDKTPQLPVSAGTEPDSTSPPLPEIENAAIGVLQNGGALLGPSCPDNLCLYNSLSYLISLNPDYNRRLIAYILRQLREVLSEGFFRHMDRDIARALMRNIIFVALQSPQGIERLKGYLAHLKQIHVANLRETIIVMIDQICQNRIQLIHFTPTELLDQLQSCNTDSELIDMLQQLIEQEHLSPGLSMAIANALNTLFGNEEFMFTAPSNPVPLDFAVTTDLLDSLTDEWLQPDFAITPALFFLGVGLFWINHPPENITAQLAANLQQWLLPQQITGTASWADQDMLQFIVLPMLATAGLPAAIQMVNVATETPHTPITAIHMEFQPAAGFIPPQVTEHVHDNIETILESVNNPTIFSLFHGWINQNAAQQGGQHYQLGTHWQPLIPQEQISLIPIHNPQLITHNRKRTFQMSFSRQSSQESSDGSSYSQSMTEDNLQKLLSRSFTGYQIPREFQKQTFVPPESKNGIATTEMVSWLLLIIAGYINKNSNIN